MLQQICQTLVNKPLGMNSMMISKRVNANAPTLERSPRFASTFVIDLMVMLTALIVTTFLLRTLSRANMFRFVARWHKCRASLRSTTAVWSQPGTCCALAALAQQKFHFLRLDYCLSSYV